MRFTALSLLGAAAAATGAQLATATPMVSHQPPQPLAEEIHYDALGNMVWDTSRTLYQQAKSAVAAHAQKQLTAPDFSHIDVQAEAAREWELLAHAASELAEEGSASAHYSLLAAVDGMLRKASKAAHKAVEHGKHLAHNALHTAAGEQSKWLHQGRVVIDGISYEQLVHPAFPDYTLRLTSQRKEDSSEYCADEAYAVSGYLDIRSTAHLFFTFHEARNNPDKAPLTLWLNGGPGCSSMTGALFENGPCSIKDEDSTTVNKYSWSNNSNLIFLDQPVSGVGFSYSEGEQDVTNTPAAAKDVYAFLQLFLTKFPKYSKAPFHVAGESYAGFYIPNVGSTIFKENKATKAAGAASSRVHINLDSLLIGNGLSEPAIQFPSTYDWACGADNPYHLFDPESATCQGMKGKAKTCANMIEQCTKYNSRLVCTPAALYCWSSMYQPMQATGLNLYDVRKTCNRDPNADGPLCYKEMEWIEKFLNKPSVKSELGVPSSVNFVSCNTAINQKFLFAGDSMHSAAALLPEMLDDKEEPVRVLIYNGLADAMCNSIGNARWVAALNSSFHAEYNGAKETAWSIPADSVEESKHSRHNGKGNDPSKKNKQVGTVQAAGGSKKQFGNLAFVKVFEAGHMVPFNQRAASLDMFDRWVANHALA